MTMHTPARCSGTSGFTLVEVLIALAILGVGILALTTMQVVIGKKRWKPSRWMVRSPGRRPRPSLVSHGRRRPMAISATPTVIRRRAVADI